MKTRNVILIVSRIVNAKERREAVSALKRRGWHVETAFVSEPLLRPYAGLPPPKGSA